MNQKRRDTVTQAQVSKAAEQLTADGKSVSMNSVREIVGGSFTTLGPMIKHWKNERQSAHHDIAIPDDILETMKRVTAELWQSASQQANEEVEKIRAESQVKSEQLEAEVEEFQQEVQRLETQSTESDAKAKDLEGQIDEKDKVICELKAETAVLQSRVEDKDTLIHELKDQLTQANQKIDGLQAELVSIAKQSQAKK